MPHKLLTGAAAFALLLGVPLAGEAYAGARLGGDVRTTLRGLAPDATVTRVEPHGRPFLLAVLRDEVSSAYADVRGPSGITTTVILQRLHRSTGRVNTVLWFTRTRQPIPLTPDRAPGGAYTPRGTARLHGHSIEATYRAAVTNGTLTVTPQTVTVDARPVTPGALPHGWAGKLTPPPQQVPLHGPAQVRAVSVGDHDITVELQQNNPRPATRP